MTLDAYLPDIIPIANILCSQLSRHIFLKDIHLLVPCIQNSLVRWMRQFSNNLVDTMHKECQIRTLCILTCISLFLEKQAHLKNNDNCCKQHFSLYFFDDFVLVVENTPPFCIIKVSQVGQFPTCVSISNTLKYISYAYIFH